MQVEVVRHYDGPYHAQSLLYGAAGAILAVRDDGAFQNIQLVGAGINILTHTEEETEEEERFINSTSY